MLGSDKMNTMGPRIKVYDVGVAGLYRDFRSLGDSLNDFPSTSYYSAQDGSSDDEMDKRMSQTSYPKHSVGESYVTYEWFELMGFWPRCYSVKLT